MLKKIVEDLFEYNQWANETILHHARKLTPEQLDQPQDFPHGTFRATLVHTLSGEWMWRTRIESETSPTTLLDPADFPTLADIETRWAKENEHLARFLVRLTDMDLRAEIIYKTTKGIPYRNQCLHLLQHIVLHGMQHRSEMAAMLTNFGHSPGNIDLIMYYRNK